MYNSEGMGGCLAIIGILAIIGFVATCGFLWWFFSNISVVWG